MSYVMRGTWTCHAMVLALLAGTSTGCGGHDIAALDQGDGGMSGGSDRSVPANQSGTLIGISDGKLEGKVVGDTREFLGIPYARPPVGDLRFAPPEPAEPWTDTRSAMEFGPWCPQSAGLVQTLAGATNWAIDEDCLTLNVYTPGTPPAKPLPVMAFLHGGGFKIGAGAQYDGQKLSEAGPVVVVTINYRMAALGFLSLPELDATRPGAPSGNDAIRDQQLALRWVKDNISAFGGDPRNVTLFGESAGAISTCIHLVAPGSKDLAQRLIMESGGCVAKFPFMPVKANTTALSRQMAGDLCSGESDVLACLRAKPASDIIDWGANVGGIIGALWLPSVEGEAGGVLPDTPENLIASGNYNKAPFIVGSNKSEAGLFQLVGQTKKMSTVLDLENEIDQTFPSDAAAATALKAQYAAASDAEANNAYIRLLTDLAFRCPARTLLRTTTDKGQKAYLYTFEEGTAYHSDELTYVFGFANGGLSQLLGGGQPPSQVLMDAVPRYWTHFARSADPNGDGNPEWPAFATASDQHMTLKTPPEAGSHLSKSDCDFWDEHSDLSTRVLTRFQSGGSSGM
jgi:para-nitrobenzyl esterase